MDTDGPQSDRPPRSRPQFSLRLAFLITLLVAVTAAVWGGLVRGGSDLALFLFFGAAAPLGVLLLVGLLHQLLRGRR